MLRYVAKRCGTALVVTLLVTLVVFVLTRVLFPDPALAIFGGQGSSATAQQVAQFRAEMGLNNPLILQYLDWLWQLVQGDLGRSFRTPIAVSALIGNRLPVTLELMALAMLIAIVAGMTIGILSAVYRGGSTDATLSTGSILALSLPNFFLGILLVYAFAIELSILPSGGWVPFTKDPVGYIRHAILPAVTLSFAYIGNFSRYARALVINVLSEEYILRAHASGLSPVRVIMRHALRNVSIPMVTVFGVEAAGLVGGAVVTETIFSVPGIGTLFVNALLGKDFPVLQGVIVVITVGVVVLNLLVDLAYGFLDPRVRLS